MGNGVIPLMLVAMVPIIGGTIGQRALSKRNAPTNLDYPDYSTKYDEYPVVVPKRAALLFDQLMVALQKVVDNQNRGEFGGRTLPRSSGPHLPVGNSQNIPATDEQTVKMDLQRRGQAKGRVYWRCYFNAVTCFKRK
ncbi:uncharacterized protein LOC117160972 isoform X1 [Bombus vancouverensis nearcticus]|uniref:Uncharacterized protein LOC117211364 isoform X1 n=1 Tax=Bombus bifarius TaxID=103933 RepID=A0A6P8MBB7_9HYME|nr:uncharacterized protein LOC117160972 isoform X1 [Bombus vancouverensis nearcticus]XP_033311036.1 uncharacterized protein LOC117211364 isoform X1 [Bombus bifarius]XP_050471565.1 uncharacterized protein LOC126864328 isoform X1 [Bombus huntii]